MGMQMITDNQMQIMQVIIIFSHFIILFIDFYTCFDVQSPYGGVL